MIKQLIGMELAYINTNHPDFVGGQEAVSRIMEKRNHSTRGHNPNPQPHLSDQVPLHPLHPTAAPVDIQQNPPDSASEDKAEHPTYEVDGMQPSLSAHAKGIHASQSESTLPNLAHNER
ncbi:hypothetical protein SARC_00881 [Sphaeroforma arctica JP610]|uniref:Dynamin stalk domain-containing protein n=1 Tax=Sphaeroforma arctica JP610 TaxID=667725 RepID=A0A0L0GFD4_9EUKA|nr:hypothetical protein SARC_00881 [Sphaeroforma arctica JP610]KNC86988.1 hypothetical protein SARC_00881 [Sphaeroforma arctica JP610]|eukprot:XP_014160890.1 hypothetical protein SARC_00881 [Sphaeroforma arctica JP610]